VRYVLVKRIKGVPVEPVIRDVEKPVQFGQEEQPQIYMASGLSPEAASYGQQVRARMQAKRVLKKTNTPIGGVPEQPIPPLDQPHQTGLTMAQQAELHQAQVLRNAQAALAAGAVPGGVQESFVEPPSRTRLEPQGNPAALGILPGDLLPDEAQKDPNFIQGHGSMVAAAQPGLAMKYGVVRGGRHVPWQHIQNPRGEQKQLRPETIDGLKKLQELKQQGSEVQAAGLHQTEQQAEERADQEMPEVARAAGTAGNLPGDDETKPLSEEEKGQISRAIGNLDELDLDKFRQQMMKDILNNDEQRQIVEARLEPLSLDDLILHNYVTQVVPVIVVDGVKKFYPTFRSISAEEDLAAKRLIMQESSSIEVSERYLIDKYAIMGIALGTEAINGKPLGGHTDAQGNFDDEKFVAKLNRILKLPTDMIASLGVHHFWFSRRVRKLFVAEKVGNG
jgi:hypothetical protein